MKEVAEREIKIGYERNSKTVLNEIERTAESMKKKGWNLTQTSVDETLGSVFLFFERELETLS